MSLYTAKTLREALGDEIVRLEESENISIESATTDSRLVEDGSLFIARKGEKIDGHDFIGDVLKKNSNNNIWILAERLPEGIETEEVKINPRIILVKSTATAIEKLAKFSRQRLKGNVIGITGSIGKTSTKDALYRCLSAFGSSHCNRKSLNNQIGVPLTLINTPEDTEFSIFEMGTGEPGEMSYLESFVRPTLAMILDIKRSHMEFFKTEEAIATEKSSIVGDDTRMVVLNAADSWYQFIRDRITSKVNGNIGTFGTADATVQLLEHKIVNGGAEVSYRVRDKIHRQIFSNEDYNIAWNIQAVLCVVDYFNLSVERALETLSQIETTRGRNNIEYGSCYDLNNKKINITLINGAYNAVAPETFIGGLKLMDTIFKKGKNGRKICIWGDMLEVGDGVREAHRGLAESLMQHNVDLLITFGEHMNDMADFLSSKLTHSGNGPKILSFENANDIIGELKSLLRDGDLLFIKSSRGMKSFEILNSLVENKMEVSL